MIYASLIINTSGQVRLTKWYKHFKYPRIRVRKHIYNLLWFRGHDWANFFKANDLKRMMEIKDDTYIVYRNYATLFFILVVDEDENFLAMLDLIQVWVESLDRAFENVCELDIVYHWDEAHFLTDEIIQGGLVLNIDVNDIYKQYKKDADARKASYNEANPLSLSNAIGPRAGGSGTPLGWLTSRFAGGSGSR